MDQLLYCVGVLGVEFCVVDAAVDGASGDIHCKFGSCADRDDCRLSAGLML